MQDQKYQQLSKELKDNLSRLMQKRSNWEAHWQEIANYMLTRRADIVSTKSSIHLFDIKRFF